MELNFSIKLLKSSYIFQFILLIMIIIFNILYKNTIIWMGSFLSIRFNILIIILGLISLFPIIFLIITSFKKTYKAFFTLLKISSAITFGNIGIVIGIIILYFYTDNNYPIFYRNCPFNYKLSDIEVLFTSYKNYNNVIGPKLILELKGECEKKRCIFQNNINEDIYKYSYICNYNSTEDFKYTYENSIICEKPLPKDIVDFEIMITYLNLCNSLVDFYLCNITKIPIKYDIKSSYSCPTKNKKSIILEILLSILNIIFPISIFIIEYIYYKKILKLIVTMNIQRVSNDNVNYGTVDTSKKTGLNKDDSSFKKERTELIIVENKKNEDEIYKIYNRNKYKKKIKRNITNIKSELIMINNRSTATNYPYYSNEKSKGKGEKYLKNDNNGINRSFSNLNSNYLNNNKNDMLSSMRILTEINNEENIKYELKEKEKNLSKGDSKVKCILIDKK